MFGWSNSDGASGGLGGANLPMAYQGDGPNSSGVAGPAAGDPFSAMAGALVSGLFAYYGGERANKSNERIAREATLTNISEAEKNRLFQALMSNSAHQRQVADLEKAGLNPLLAAGQNGASTPGGSTASAETAHMENTLGAAISTAGQAAQIGLQFQKQESEIGLMREQGELARSTALKNAADTRLSVEQMGEAKTRNKFFNEVGKLIDGYKKTNSTGNIMKWYNHFTQPKDPKQEIWQPPVKPGPAMGFR